MKSVKIAVAVVLLLVAGGVMYWQFVGRGGSYAEVPKKIWFYDVSAKKLIAADVGTPSPTATPSGGEAFRAYVYSCSGCENVNGSNIVYLERAPKIDPSLPKMMQIDRAQLGAEIAAPDRPDAWISAADPAAADLKTTIITMCDGKPGVPCSPDAE